MHDPHLHSHGEVSDGRILDVPLLIVWCFVTGMRLGYCVTRHYILCYLPSPLLWVIFHLKDIKVPQSFTVVHWKLGQGQKPVEMHLPTATITKSILKPRLRFTQGGRVA